MSRSTRTSASDSVPFLGAGRGGSGGGGGGHSQSAGRNRQAEMAAAFGGQDDDDDEGHDNDGFSNSLSVAGNGLPPSYGYSSPPSSSAGNGMSGNVEGNDDVFFDAGDALASASDPLGAAAMDDSSRPAPTTTYSQQARDRQGAGNTERAAAASSGYDFEQASYFTPPPPASRRTPSALSRSNSESQMGPGDVSISMSEADGETSMSGGPLGGSSSGNMAGLDATGLSRARMLLGRFGRFVGMRVPGATYASLSTQDDAVQATRRRIMGSGISQDGVFANLNAKPERRRRRADGEDRGDDDDLVEDTLPPTYETAAADTAPPYWETTIIGGPGGLHPLAPGGMGWTPGGAHVGAIEDLIVDGLPVGNFFGFAWNLLVSMSFQFVGFLLTYLLHTTHAARCGSRAGLGITLVQYGFYLRTRAIQIVDGKLPDDGLSGLPGDSGSQGGQQGGPWWMYPNQPADDSESHNEAARSFISRGLSFVARQVTEATASASVGGNATMAEALANDTNPPVTNAQDLGASTEWLAYILMALGWFILFSSLLSYWRVHRWGKQLVDAARRDAESSNNANNDEAGAETSTSGGASGSATAPRDPNAPIGFIHTLRAAFERSRTSTSSATGGTGASGASVGSRGHSAEDWVIFPGMTAAGSASRSRLLFGGVGGLGGGPMRGRRRSDLEVGEAEANRDSDDDDDSDEEGASSAEARRLVTDLRNVGLIE